MLGPKVIFFSTGGGAFLKIPSNIFGVFHGLICERGIICLASCCCCFVYRMQYPICFVLLRCCCCCYILNVKMCLQRHSAHPERGLCPFFVPLKCKHFASRPALFYD